MATFDPTVGVHVSPGSGPSMGGAPQLISSHAAASALGHILSSWEIKRDTNANARGQAAAHEHLGNISQNLLSFKAQHLADDNFDEKYAQEIDKQLEAEKARSKYESNNEKEELAYQNAIQSFRQNELVRSFGEGMKAYLNKQENTLNFVVDNYKNRYVNAANPEEAKLIEADIFNTFVQATQQKGKYPGIITPEQGQLKFVETMRVAEISRLSATASERELFELGHKSGATIEIGHVTAGSFRAGELGGERMQLVLSEKEKEGMIAFALKRQKDKIAFEENVISYSDKISYAMRTAKEKEFYDGISKFEATDRLARIDSLRAATREDGKPLFTGSEMAKFEDYARTVRDRVAEEAQNPIVTDRTAESQYLKMIFERAPGAPLPDPSFVMGDGRLKHDAASRIVSYITGEHQRAQTHDRTDFDTRRAQGKEYLKATLGGDAFIELTDNAKNFYADLLGAYYSRIEQHYDKAVKAGNSLESIKPMEIVNRLVEERSNEMNKIFFPDIGKQIKSLSFYVHRVPKDLPDNTPVSAVLNEIVRDMKVAGIDPSRPGTLPNVEGIRYIQILRAAQTKYRTIGELRKALEVETVFIPSGGKSNVATPSNPLSDTIKEMYNKLKNPHGPVEKGK